MALEQAVPRENGTAVVLVHGLREKRPMEVLDGFTKTTLAPHVTDGDQTWLYYPRPTVVTDTYEARCYSTIPQHAEAETEHTDVFEYTWAYLGTSHRSAGFGATALRLFLRRPSNVPDSLFGMWRRVWIVLMAILLAAPALFAAGYLLSSDVPGSIVGLVSGAVVLIFWFGLFRFVIGAMTNSKIAAPLVAVARYLDPAPDSYASRRAIRGGLVDLLHDLHDGRYSRVIVVAHGVGTYIAYDALAAFWAQTPTPKLQPVEDDGAGHDDFQSRQSALWQDLRTQGIPWRITDFVTIGAPLALADLLVARVGISSGFTDSDLMRRRELFDALVDRGVLVRCPPRSESLSVDARAETRGGGETLGCQSPFAVTRWTNMWFPVTRGSVHGDWFGGPLGALFGPGIRDIEVQGNRPERLNRGSAHTEYFTHPDKGDEGDVAWHLRSALALQSTPKSVD